ncbi:MAG: hypothetical protein ABH834_02050 [Candidatus Altiarchaeota archaeon]
MGAKRISKTRPKPKITVRDGKVTADVPGVGKLDLSQFPPDQLEELLPALTEPDEAEEKKPGKHR